MTTPATHSEEPLRRLLAAPLLSRSATGGDHLDPELIAVHATNELTPEEALEVTRHLGACDDGRCLAVLREVLAGVATAREALYGPRRDEPSVDSSARLSQPLSQAQSERSFECSPALWEAFEELARREGCSVDALINEAMKIYAQPRSTPLPPLSLRLHPSPTFSEGSSMEQVIERNTPTMPRAYLGMSGPLEPARERNTPTLQRSYQPAPRSQRRSPSRPIAPPPSPAAMLPPRLSLLCDGVRYEVTKPRFVIGRGSLSSDLAIQDPDVSRQHALIELVEGSYQLVDMGSTNGLEHLGERVTRCPIAHGDRFRIGDHELEFLYGEKFARASETAPPSRPSSW